jgi:hypothetical protein
MGILANILGADNPLAKWTLQNQNLLSNWGAGIGSGRTFGEGLGMAAQMGPAGIAADQQVARDEAEKAERLEAINQSAKDLAKFPDLMQAVASKAITPQAAYGEMWKRMSPDYAGGGNANMGLTPLWGTDANGNPVLGQMSSAGGVDLVDMPEGVTFGKEPIRLDAGDKFVLLDPVTRQQIGVIPKNGDVPTGFQQNGQGGITPMPGGEQDIDRQTNLFKMEQRAAAADQKAEVVVNAIDQATSQSTWATTGVLGNMGRGVGLTPHRDLQGTIDTIRANLGFNELQAMREASPTGGALGQVAIQELAMLQSTIASLDPSQSEEQLDKNLKIIRDLLERQKMYRQAALEEQQTILGGGQTAAPGSVTSTGVPWSFEP